MSFQLNHINLPARDVQAQVRWYSENFGLAADRHLARGPGVLIAFVQGEPVSRAPELHLGFQVPSMDDLKRWAGKFGKEIRMGPEFNSFQVADPGGNCLEIYTKANP